MIENEIFDIVLRLNHSSSTRLSKKGDPFIMCMIVWNSLRDISNKSGNVIQKSYSKLGNYIKR